MNHVLRDKVDRSWMRMDLCALLTQFTIQEQFDYRQNILQEPPPPEAAAGLISLNETIRVICIRDIVGETRKELADFEGVEIEEHRFSKVHPSRCGVKIFAIKTSFHEMSLQWANARSSILAAAHLHNAPIAEGITQSYWRDMFLFTTL